MGGSQFNSQEDPVSGDGSAQEGFRSGRRLSLKKTSSAFDGPAAAEQLLAFHTAHLVVVVPGKFRPSPDSPTKEEKGGMVRQQTASVPGLTECTGGAGSQTEEGPLEFP